MRNLEGQVWRLAANLGRKQRVLFTGGAKVEQEDKAQQDGDCCRVRCWRRCDHHPRPHCVGAWQRSDDCGWRRCLCGLGPGLLPVLQLPRAGMHRVRLEYDRSMRHMHVTRVRYLGAGLHVPA